MKSTAIMSLFEVGYCLVNESHYRNEANMLAKSVSDI